MKEIESVPKKRSSRQKEAARRQASWEQRRRLENEERFREEHARLVAERSGDPRFVQRTRAADGSVQVSWHADSAMGGQMNEAFAAQTEAFRAKFGRDPGPDDPLFFDPDADEPVALSRQGFDRALGEMAERAAEVGVDPAMIHAWREVGYIVTQENRHTFSAEEVRAFTQAVARHHDELDDKDEDYDKPTPGELARTVNEGMSAIVTKILDTRDPDWAHNVTAGTDALEEDDAGYILSFMFAALAAWLAGTRENGLGTDGARAVLEWIRTELSPDTAESAMVMAGMIGHPDAPDLTVDEATTRLDGEILEVMIWLATGLVATAGAGDVQWIRRFDVDSGTTNDR
ncbi:hypothetical protein [Embleya sp. NPDC059259]|uniref:hypothetical protein n=1 Tax=unclassified Embleya TaxID=2699296 RepID=UPI0036AE8DEF